ncbi:hypothetical protein [Halomonas sp. H10-9-1]|uniref:hypothetical protein n=1 Tax=Halomonas sp. H10-9-1 TaxID=2950871 RepID=UPI0032DE2DB8
MHATPIRGETPAARLAANASLLDSLRVHPAAGQPVLAEPAGRDGACVACHFPGHFPAAPALVAALFHGRTPWP